ncbi:MAG: serine/threonine protein kinase [Kiritimatiellae bacterium]|nr:serine/threonine protein kinase [Kiritimatiellia bacterium]
MTEGERFRGYIVERRIGKGSYGAVYKVRHEVMDTPFALKVLDPAVADGNPEYVKRFVREAKLASRLHHPTLVAVHDAGYDDGHGLYYIVMDYVQGGTLREAIALGGAMDDKEAVRIIGQVASALDAAGALGVVHRDVKPENIILTSDGAVKLIDLGVAKVSREIDSVKTMANTVFGTPGYMSPEQAADSSTVDTRSDVYSLGVVFYEMLCGRSPYASKSTERIVLELLSADPIPDVRTFNSKVSVKLSAVLMLMCAKRVEDRMKSPGELLATLRRLGYDVPEPVAHGCNLAASGDDEPFSYNVPLADCGGDAMTFDTKDEEIQAFVKGLRRKRFRTKALLALAVAVAAATIAAIVLYVALFSHKIML